MKKLQLIFTLPFCILGAACSSDNASAPENEKEFNAYNIELSVLPTRADAGGATLAAVDEYSYSEDRIHFAAYTTDGKLKNFIYSGGALNEAIDAKFYEANWGHTVSALLPKSDCEMGFAMTFFSVPKGWVANDAFTLKDLDQTDFRLIPWPGKAEANYVWPSALDQGKFQLPMAGLRKVSREYMKMYNPNVYNGLSPFRLENVEPVRAMAKIVVEDPDEVIGTVTLKSPDRGYLCPDGEAWLAGGIVPPAVPAGMTILDQTLDGPNAVVKDATGNDVKAFVFYSFEQSFAYAKGDDDVRKIIKVVAHTLKDKDGNPATTTLSIAPYDNDGYPDGSLSGDEIMVKDGGAWQGVMRNRIYTYSLNAPRNMGMEVRVHVKNWDYEKIDTEF